MRAKTGFGGEKDVTHSSEPDKGLDAALRALFQSTRIESEAGTTPPASGEPDIEAIASGADGSRRRSRSTRRSVAVVWGSCIAGAMGDLGREVAIKLLRPEHAASTRMRP